MRKIIQFKKGKLIGALLVLIAVFVFSSAVFAYPGADYVSVPNVKQQYSNWCWAGVSNSILTYYGKSVSQCTFVTYVKGSCVNVGATVTESQTGLSHWGVSSTRTNTSLAYSTIITEIYNYNRPIFAAWEWYSGGGHALLIKGYDITDDYVSYMDPWDGYTHTMTYSQFLGGPSYDHKWYDSLYHMPAK